MASGSFLIMLQLYFSLVYLFHFRLIDHLDAYLERRGRSLRIQQERKGFPATITLAKAIATWKYVAEVDYKRKQELHH